MKKEIIKIFSAFNIILVLFISLAIKAFNTDMSVFYLSIGFIIVDVLYQIQLTNDLRKMI